MTSGSNSVPTGCAPGQVKYLQASCSWFVTSTPKRCQSQHWTQLYDTKSTTVWEAEHKMNTKQLISTKIPEAVVFSYWLPKTHLKLDLSISSMLLVEKKTHIGHNAKLHNNFTSKSTDCLEKRTLLLRSHALETPISFQGMLLHSFIHSLITLWQQKLKWVAFIRNVECSPWTGWISVVASSICLAAAVSHISSNWRKMCKVWCWPRWVY
jgi:hypothetical protein